MKYVISCIAALALTLGLSTSAFAEAIGPKPLVVLSLTSHDDLAGNTDGIGELAKVADLPTWFSSMLKLFDEGKGASGLDTSRPWGAVIQLGDGLSAYGFIPVRDAEDLLWDIDEYIEDTEEIGWELYRVTGTEQGKQLYARVTGNWVYVADSREDLAQVAGDPAALLEGLNKRYDVALGIQTKNIPAEEGRELINLLGNKLGSVVRKHASEQALNFLGEALYASEQVTMGWEKH